MANTYNKIKMFSNNSAYSLENDINDFIKSKNLVDIKYSTYENKFNQTEYNACVIYKVYK
ncbi:sporulation protein Cse60 [Terrisporobacter sp.]|uniref:sporulation protein Cse60 n=1 Tax=Terrisporobacter sp. TaxID=1965305 RepID=UPI002897F1EF|nr:sporulation protein Cse60 [Terrisporobacter sp.]